jgi:hypothetical protein
MKASLSLFLTGVLMMGAASLAFGDDSRENSDNKAKHASSSHRSHSSTHHRSTGSQHHNNTNSGSKDHSNIPANSN